MLNLALVSMGTSFVSNLLSAKNQYDEALASADIERQSADIYRKNAETTRYNGALNEDIDRAKNRSYLSLAQTSFNEAGMGESPTAMSSLATSASGLEQNVLYNRYQTESLAEQYLYQARVAEENARVMKKNARNKFYSSLISGVF